VLDVWVPYTNLAPETAALAERVGAHLAALDPADPDDYGRFMAARWKAGRGFILVEHDVVPSVAQIVRLAACSDTLCMYGYRGAGERPEGPVLFGCVKFSPGLIARSPDLWIRYLAAATAPEGHPDHDFSSARCQRWNVLPEWIAHALAVPVHWHGRVLHLHRSASSPVRAAE
jgi:hypothetical protein